MINKIKKIITAAIVLITWLVFGGQIALSTAVLLSILLFEIDNKKIAWTGLTVAALLPFLTIVGLKTLAASLAPWLFFLLAGVFAAHLFEYAKTCFAVDSATQTIVTLPLLEPVAILPMLENTQEQIPVPVLIAEKQAEQIMPVIIAEKKNDQEISVISDPIIDCGFLGGSLLGPKLLWDDF